MRCVRTGGVSHHDAGRCDGRVGGFESGIVTDLRDRVPDGADVPSDGAWRRPVIDLGATPGPARRVATTATTHAARVAALTGIVEGGAPTHPILVDDQRIETPSPLEPPVGDIDGGGVIA